MIGLNTNEDDIHKEFRTPRLAKDENHVERMISVIKDRVNPFDGPGKCVFISSGVTVSPEIKQDLPGAERAGDTLVTGFLKNRIVSNNVSFFDPLPRQNLKTVKDAVNTKKIKVNGKEHILKADRKLFGRLAVIAQSRALNMREVLKYPLGPYRGLWLVLMVIWQKLTKLSLQKYLKEVQSQQWMIQNVLHGFSMVWLCCKL